MLQNNNRQKHILLFHSCERKNLNNTVKKSTAITMQAFWNTSTFVANIFL